MLKFAMWQYGAAPQNSFYIGDRSHDGKCYRCRAADISSSNSKYLLDTRYILMPSLLLTDWYRTAKSANWKNLIKVQKNYPH